MPLSTTNCLDTMSGNDGGQYLSNEKLSSVEVLETSDQVRLNSFDQLRNLEKKNKLVLYVNEIENFIF